jgi:hypothetical protein
MADKKPPTATATTPAPEASTTETGLRLLLDDSNVPALYANFCRVASTPEEVILDLALNPNPMPGPNVNGTQRLQISQRVILNHFTAKRLAALLGATLQRHEQAFGPVEIDIRKRIRPGAGDAAPAQ